MNSTDQHRVQPQTWNGPKASIATDATGMRRAIQNLDRPCFVVQTEHSVGVTNEGAPGTAGDDYCAVIAFAPPLSPGQLGCAAFRSTYGLDYAYVGGSMANGISSTEMVIALGEAGMMGSFGAGGLVPQRIEAAIEQIRVALPAGPYLFNLINSPLEPVLEERAVDLYLKYGVHCIEASAYVRLTTHVVRYRTAGLIAAPDGSVQISHRVLAKVSRREVARHFMEPAPVKMLGALVDQGMITENQAALAERVPMADDVTVEADSGGHTDNRPLVCQLPAILALRDEIQAKYNYATPIRVGAAGGISTPAAALGAFMMGAAYVMTGSVNQSCREAGTSDAVKAALAEAETTDVTMAPAADMFEIGSSVQVLKRGTLFPMRAKKLYRIYQSYASVEAIPADERLDLEKRIFHHSLDEIWRECVTFFEKRDPRQIERAKNDPKLKMALIFRWYLGSAVHWGIGDVRERTMDYQVWCGPAMGAFNDWARGTDLESVENRRVAEVGRRIMDGAAHLYRLQTLQMQGFTPAGS
jgi:trans-AT polyketide synthase/acyltransferase/oxidoreductase domain-containing protein